MVVQAGMFIDESLGEMEEVGRRLPRAEFRRAAIRHLLRLALRGRNEEEGE